MDKILHILQVSLIVGIALSVQSTSAHAEILKEPNLVQSETENSSAKKFAFDFNNTYDYASCLDIILLSYEKRNIELGNAAKNDCGTNVLKTFGDNLSKSDALRLVEAADRYATEDLANPLYPTLGLRRRIAINLGYVYKTDKNNPDILKYINPDSTRQPDTVN